MLAPTRIEASYFTDYDRIPPALRQPVSETMLASAALPFNEGGKIPNAVGRSAVQLDVFDLAVCAVIRQFDFLGVENNRVLDFAVIRQPHVNALIAHPAFRLADQKPCPFFWQANGHGGICTGPVTVLGGEPFTKITSTPPPGCP
jgi:hypothetical protein